jgi:signal transduction histidine kinase
MDKADAEREKLLTEAKGAIRAREDLLSIVSHDLRNPLSAMILNATQIGRSAPENGPGPRIRKYAQAILSAADQMSRLVSDLLDLSKIEMGKVLPIEKRRWDGSDLARQALETLEPLANSLRLTLELDLPSGACALYCDGDRVSQVLSNLIGNAMKFTREGGSIVVQTRKSGREIIFSVRDTGTGIPADQLPHLFEPYWQARATRKGIGLGLSVSKAIVQAHGGRIWVESTVGRGSAFYFALPSAEGEADSTSTADSPQANAEEHSQ